ncbi:sensor histidine kinase [Paucibacter sp. KBW04]|uniref:sensor histidine kinase n=1 Tax=Paucibacter sp. KBW04 TaxID=2153361 RepID=UPI001E5A9A97|nr:ATP-binding protein [Paucibacter sp. KBW04]
MQKRTSNHAGTGQMGWLRRFNPIGLAAGASLLLAALLWPVAGWSQAASGGGEPMQLQLGFSALQAHQWLLGMLLILSITAEIIARLYPRESQVSCLGSMMLAGVAYQVLRFATVAPALWLQAVILLMLALVVMFGMHYLTRQLDKPLPRLEQALWWQVFVAPACVLIAGFFSDFALARIWHAALTLELVVLLAWYLRQRWTSLQAITPVPAKERADLLKLSALIGLCCLAMLGDQALAMLPLLPAWTVWLVLAQPVLMIALGLQFVASFARARRDSDLRQVQIEQGMAEKVAEMERSFAGTVEQKLEQVTERERKRIAADLHDDLGAKLLTIVHTSESDRISTLAREALEEMRLSVRGLTGKPVQLLDALGDWRAEVVSRLGQANILAEWKAPAEDVVHTLPARAYVQTTRIFREAVSNIIKHSGGTHCTISCNVQDGDFLVVIQDNGQGIPAELDGRLDRGHGMASMKSRAKQMHGQCLVESGPGWGTVIRLTIPL